MNNLSSYCGLVDSKTNPQYYKRLFVDLPVQFMKTTSSEHGNNMLCTKIILNVKTKNNSCTQHVSTQTCNPTNNLLSYRCKNKCFWKRFTCTSCISKVLVNSGTFDYSSGYFKHRLPDNSDLASYSGNAVAVRSALLFIRHY